MLTLRWKKPSGAKKYWSKTVCFFCSKRPNSTPQENWWRNHVSNFPFAVPTKTSQKKKKHCPNVGGQLQRDISSEGWNVADKRQFQTRKKAEFQNIFFNFPTPPTRFLVEDWSKAQSPLAVKQFDDWIPQLNVERTVWRLLCLTAGGEIRQKKGKCLKKCILYLLFKPHYY